MPVRMTVIRLGSGDLWVHSPIRPEPGLLEEIETLGTVRHLVAPNIAHWTFLAKWQELRPAALVWAPGLRRRWQVRRSVLRIDRELEGRAPGAWSAEIEQTVVPGGGGFREVHFFHRKSRTLVLTDLIVNIDSRDAPFSTRAYARLTGTRAPKGEAPLYLHLLVLMRRREAAAALARAVEWAPERVIFAHGRWFERDGTERLKRSFSWLLK